MKNFKFNNVLMFVVTLMLSLFGVTGVETMFAAAPAAAVATGQPDSPYGDGELGGDGAIGDGFQSLDEALRLSPNLVTRAIHDQVIKIAPYDYTARSLLSKNFKQRKKTKDHTVAVYSARTKPIQLTLNVAHTKGETETVELDFGAGNKLISVNQTITFLNVSGYNKAGNAESGKPLQLYVTAKGNTGKPVVKALNGILNAGAIVVPDIDKDEKALRGLRVGTETQIRTEPTNILPTDREYYIQKNIIEFGSTGWWDSATKEVKWTDRDRMEMALEEKIRTSMPNFWLGTAGESHIKTEYNAGEELAYFSEGIWTQAGREFNFNNQIDVNKLVDFAKYIFTGNRSSNVKYLVMGSELSAAFQKVIFANPVYLGETYKDKTLNIEFTSINFFGGKKILFADDPSLDDIGMGDCGFVLDHKYAFEYHYGMMTVPIDGISTATADVKGQSIVEENSFILTNNEAHCRVTLGSGSVYGG